MGRVNRWITRDNIGKLDKRSLGGDKEVLVIEPVCLPLVYQVRSKVKDKEVFAAHLVGAVQHSRLAFDVNKESDLREEKCRKEEQQALSCQPRLQALQPDIII